MNWKVLGAATSFIITVLYVTACGREGKVLLTDNYKAQPIGLTHTENSSDGKSGTGFSTDTTKAEASLDVVDPLDFFGATDRVAFNKTEVIDCRAKSAGPGLLEINVRFSNETKGSFAASYITEFDSKILNASFDSRDLTRVSFQDSSRSVYLAQTSFTDANCALKTSFIKNKEIRGTVNCKVRGAKKSLDLNGTFSCHLLGAM